MGRQIILEVDTSTARELEAVAPARDRRRSEFLRRALRKALDEEIEARMRDAYDRQPDDSEAPYFEPAAWERTRGRAGGPAARPPRRRRRG
jgi:hypothetical protein